MAQGLSRFKFVITDMFGNIVGEVLNASNKEFIQRLDNTQLGKFTVKISNPMADFILNNDCLCKCYRRPINPALGYRLLLVGDVYSMEEDTTNETGTITFTVTDPLNRLLYRMLGKAVDVNNHGLGWADGTSISLLKVGDIIGDMLDAINTDPDLGFSGVEKGFLGPVVQPMTYLAAVYFQPFATQLALFTTALDGVDFWMEPMEPHLVGSPYPPGNPAPEFDPSVFGIVPGTTVANTVIARLNIYYPVGNYLVSPGPPAVYSQGHTFPVFEYGVGKHNIQSYVRTKDKSQLVNRWYNFPDGFPIANLDTDPLAITDPTTPTSEGTVADSIANRGGYESVDPGDIGVSALPLRQALVNADASVTAVPRQQITFTPTINCDVDWAVDYFVGDVVTVRAFIPEANNGAGSWRFNGTVRIYGVDAVIDDNEQEQISITTIATG